MTTPQPRPLLTRDDLPLDAIAEICRRWGVLEMAVDPSQTRPLPESCFRHSCLRTIRFWSIDLYLIVPISAPGNTQLGLQETPLRRGIEDLYNLLGRQVWIVDNGMLTKTYRRGCRVGEAGDGTSLTAFMLPNGLSDGTKWRLRPGRCRYLRDYRPDRYRNLAGSGTVTEVAVNYARMDSWTLTGFARRGPSLSLAWIPMTQPSHPKSEYADVLPTQCRSFLGNRVYLSDKAALERDCRERRQGSPKGPGGPSCYLFLRMNRGRDSSDRFRQLEYWCEVAGWLTRLYDREYWEGHILNPSRYLPLCGSDW